MHLVGEIEVHGDSLIVWDKDIKIRLGRYPSMPVTASLDAAIALVEKVLPGWYMMIDGSLMTSFEVSLTDSSVPSAEVREDVSRFFARGKTLPLAILAALLRSKLSESPLASDGVSAAGESET